MDPEPLRSPFRSSKTAHVLLLGTCDTKLDEILFLRDQIHAQSHNVTVLVADVGRGDTTHPDINFPSQSIRQRLGNEVNLENMPRSGVMNAMTECAIEFVKTTASSWCGIIAVGGSSGTALASAVMRDVFPIGFPKLIVSTIASGDTGPIVEETDLMLMYSVVDIAGLNPLLRRILTNAAAAIVGMAISYQEHLIQDSSIPTNPSGKVKKRVGITMFGVTTPAVDAIRKYLESEYDIECYVFHATGHGGKAMERLVREGGLDAVLDLTTTEICDLVTGGVMSCRQDRLEAAAKAGIPNIISAGATDMTNFGPKHTVPERYKDRLLYEHNSMVTLMRSSVEESTKIGQFVAGKLKNNATKPDMVEVWLPLGGVSMLSIPGGPFEDRAADEALYGAIQSGLRDSRIAVVEDRRDINDPSFATAIAEALVKKMGIGKRQSH